MYFLYMYLHVSFTALFFCVYVFQSGGSGNHRHIFHISHSSIPLISFFLPFILSFLLSLHLLTWRERTNQNVVLCVASPKWGQKNTIIIKLQTNTKSMFPIHTWSCTSFTFDCPHQDSHTEFWWLTLSPETNIVNRVVYLYNDVQIWCSVYDPNKRETLYSPWQYNKMWISSPVEVSRVKINAVFTFIYFLLITS